LNSTGVAGWRPGQFTDCPVLSMCPAIHAGFIFLFVLYYIPIVYLCYIVILDLQVIYYKRLLLYVRPVIRVCTLVSRLADLIFSIQLLIWSFYRNRPDRRACSVVERNVIKTLYLRLWTRKSESAAGRLGTRWDR